MALVNLRKEIRKNVKKEKKIFSGGQKKSAQIIPTSWLKILCVVIINRNLLKCKIGNINFSKFIQNEAVHIFRVDFSQVF